MSISTYLEPISKGAELVKAILIDEFGINDANAQYLFNVRIKRQFDNLRDNCFLLAETSYVDKVYRNSYYHYYSSKLTPYKRDCVRISIFSGEVNLDDFWLIEKHSELQEKYLGFIVLRPTQPHIIGRTIISPKALKTNNFLCCITRFNVTVNSVKFTVEGFPHSSQDTETITCAETTLWAVMEYFSNKYSDYKPVLPSKIIETLNKVSSERQVPSKGLNIFQMSFAMKEFGFGTRIYGRAQYASDFDQILRCYIESGIPLIIAMQNDNGSIGHALLAIGCEQISDVHIDAIAPMNFSSILSARALSNNIQIFDYSSITRDLVFIDDNQPVYQKAAVSQPAAHYNNVAWSTCKIKHFVVPLYPKIYLEAFEAKNFVLNFIVSGPQPLTNNSQIVLRFYLASSRSFKNSVAQNSSIQNDLKVMLLESSMPKFIWIAEISDKDLIKQKKANGIIILDATEANISYNKPLILAAYQGNLITFDENIGKLESVSLTLQEFSIFEQNLNSF